MQSANQGWLFTEIEGTTLIYPRTVSVVSKLAKQYCYKLRFTLTLKLSFCLYWHPLKGSINKNNKLIWKKILNYFSTVCSFLLWFGPQFWDESTVSFRTHQVLSKESSSGTFSRLLHQRSSTLPANTAWAAVSTNLHLQLTTATCRVTARFKNSKRLSVGVFLIRKISHLFSPNTEI